MCFLVYVGLFLEDNAYVGNGGWEGGASLTYIHHRPNEFSFNI
jgi:hypothetical protein